MQYYEISTNCLCSTQLREEFLVIFDVWRIHGNNLLNRLRRFVGQTCVKLEFAKSIKLLDSLFVLPLLAINRGKALTDSSIVGIDLYQFFQDRDDFVDFAVFG